MGFDSSEYSNISESSESAEDYFFYDSRKNVDISKYKAVREIDGLTANSPLNIAFEGAYPQPIYNNKSVWDDFDMDSKGVFPWRDNNADLSDYFNFGFTEEIWKYYTAKQVQLRAELKMAGVSTAVEENNRRSRQRSFKEKDFNRQGRKY